LLRKHVHEGTELGLQAKKFMDSGALVPDELIVNLLKDEVSKFNKDSVLLDGFPRTLKQAEVLNESFKVDCVLNLKVPHEVIMERMSNRWIHFPSSRTYSYDYKPPKKIGFDDVTGEPLSQREDDKPEVVKRRLDHYEQMTAPLIQYYSALQGCTVQSFSGNQSDVIYPQVQKFLTEELKMTK
jgi:nucleoside-triphosphate--adenylate kinase